MTRSTNPASRECTAAEPGRRNPDVLIRPLRTYAEYQECAALQRETWGEDFTECVPAAILMVGHKIGGVTAGAFAPDGRLLGFVFGLTGVQDGRLVHWSDMLAVRRDARGRGIGKRLKAYQRERLLALGIEIAYWTYDPLVAQNAHLNLNRLGAEIAEYVPDMYGADTGSDLHSGLGTDRFVVVWRLSDDRVARAIVQDLEPDPEPFLEAPVVNVQMGDDGEPLPVEADLPTAPAVRVEIPADVQAVKAASGELAVRWRVTSRRAFLNYLGRGYRVAAFFRDRGSGRCFYGLGREAA